MHPERLWWCLPAILLCSADGLLTLWGQPDAYWVGDYANINEGHPLAAWLLNQHPLVFVAAGVPYLGLVVFLVVWMPRPLAMLAAVVAGAGHAAGVTAWCWWVFDQPALAVAIIAFALAVTCLGAFISWRRTLLAQVLGGGEIVATASGPVQFARVGTGPVILQFHGGATGYDQTLALSWDAHEVGFTVLTPSRPGYVRTPLSTGATPEQAADVMAGLLDVLGIDKVCVMGTSGGGPTALQFALRHPERVWAVVLQAAVTQQFIEPRRSTHSLLGWVVFSKSGKWLVDFGAWGVHLLAHYWPSLLIRTLLNASEDLEPAKAKERRSYVRDHPDQLEFIRRLVASGVPLSVRQTGIWNDLDQYAQLPVYPLEKIACTMLVLHGRADGNVPFAHAEFVARTAPNVELHAIEDCGHLIWLGPEAGRARERVLAFLKRHAPARTTSA